MLWISYSRSKVVRGLDDMLLHKTYVVYGLHDKWGHKVDVQSQGLMWSTINETNVHNLFSNDLRRRALFRKFLRRGFRGIVWAHGDRWVSYAWMSLPDTFGPPHLPPSIRQLQYYWIFYCRTREGYQGRGLYKASLVLLSRFAREADSAAQVYIDAEPDNYPSRRAIEATGFVPAGVIETWLLRLPRVSGVIWGRWDRSAWHPEI